MLVNSRIEELVVIFSVSNSALALFLTRLL